MTTVASAGDGVLLPETRSVSVPAYLRVLAVVLFAYAVGGKSFAYLGLPPIFMGELMLLLGLVTLPMGSLIRVVATGPGLLLLLWMYWCLWRTIPFVPTHGFDSFRDAAA
ncbi:MAG TPA: hypothetical protein VHQ68_12590, partial [Propionibacteriaceae bacterium]|nr:hypothetical protein [Propionibacteriaceae bacterium]